MAQGLKRDSVKGASDEEIGRFAAEQGVSHVPAAIQEVLRLIGTRPGLWFDGTDFGVRSGIDSAVKNHVATSALRGVDHGIRDTAGMLVLSARQGYVYQVIDAADLASDDPAVWEIVEGTSARKWPSTSAWFSDMEPLVESLRRDLERYKRNGWDLPHWSGNILPRTEKSPPSQHPRVRVRDIVERVFAAGLRRDSVVGASENEIDRFVVGQGVESVPPAVREILQLIGSEPGFWLYPMRFGVHGVDAELKSNLVSALREIPHDMRDPEGVLLLAAYPGNTYYAIDGTDLLQDDPPVWEVGVAGKTRRVRKAWGSTTGWLDAMAPNIPRARRTLARTQEQGGQIPAWAEYLEPQSNS
ncbi:hypothetical protein [Nocardia sp. SYP-A9097]|uniref:hypothetical protein n=1 Tax=Nocardia sp. SYP-A9097 TaxID=2663237 RepID=UPI00129B69FC|nr:hypothetical protein [Nocardia sp. SYP-A9097]